MISKPKNQHAAGLKLLCATEMAERFSYYSMRAILVLYLISAFMGNAEASRLYGSFAGLIYLAPLLGGYVADRFWGSKRSVIVGSCVMIIGQLMLFASSCFVEQTIFIDPVMGGTVDPTVDNSAAFWLMILGLGCLVVGNGGFKANVSSMVGELYEKTDSRLESAFTLFYMAVNVGSFFAPLLCGILTTDGGWANPGAYRWGFLCAAIAMSLSLGVFLFWKDRLLIRPDGSPIGVLPAKPAKREVSIQGGEKVGRKNWQMALCLLLGLGLFLLFSRSAEGLNDYIVGLIYSAGIALPILIITDGSLTVSEKKKIAVIYTLAVFVIFFWSAYEQSASSLTIFAEQRCDRQLYGFQVPTTWFQSINPIIVIAFAPVLAILWRWLSRRNAEPSLPAKQAIGLLLLAAGYLIIAIGTRGTANGAKASMMWLVSLLFIHSIAELAVGPIGLALVSRLSPPRFVALLFGLWYCSFAVSNALAGQLATLLPAEGQAPQTICGIPIVTLSDFFMVFACLGGGAGVLLLCLTPWLNRWIKE